MDPSILSTLIACDMGGYQLGLELSTDIQAGLFNGLFVASMLGCTLVFTIPVAFHIIQEEDKPYFSYGLLIGIITIPAGSALSGLLAGFSLSTIASNSVFIVLISVLLVLCLFKIPDQTIRICILLGKGITILTYIGLTAATFHYLTGIALIPGMMAIENAMAIVSACGITLLGTFPFLQILTVVLKRPLNTLGKLLSVNQESTSGSSSPSPIPFLSTKKCI